MKKLIISTLVIVLILVGSIWGYLFLFGAPTSTTEVFTNLGLGGEERAFEPVEEGGFSETELPKDEAIPNNALKTLSARSVADFIILSSSTSDERVRFVEQGTGHIYEITLANSQEVSLSNLTQQGVNEATISSDGKWVVLQALRDNNPFAKLVSLSETEPTIKELPPNIREVGFSEDSDRLFYVRSDSKGSIAYEYDLVKGTTAVIFSTPFIYPAVIWSENQTVVYNRPGENYPGYVYTLDQAGELVRLTNGGVGLTVTSIGDTTVVNRLNEANTYTGYLVEAGEKDIEIGKALFPEKCTGGNTGNILYCAVPRGALGSKFPFAWYKGEESLNDQIWAMNIASSTSVVVAEISNRNRGFDVIKLDTNSNSTMFVFIDKNSNTLWSFDTTKVRTN